MGEAAAPSGWARGLMLVGLASLAFTQPVLDLMGRNPEFFVAGAYTGSQIVAFAVVVVVVPSLVLLVAYALVRRVHRPTGEVIHAVLAAGLGVVLGNVVARGLGLDGWGAAVASGLVGAGVVLALRRSRGGGLLLQYLAAAQVLFLAAFLLTSPAGALISDEVDAGALGEVSIPQPPGPVVVIVFDELPLPTLLTTDGTINAERYPSFARLAASTTWFRNTSSVHAHTELAVPDLATGTVVEDGTLPTQNELPRNLIALLSTAMPVHRLEPVTDLCPHDACARRDGQPLSQAIEDSAIVYGHRVLPPALRERLADIDEAWGSFGAGVEGDEGAVDEADPLGRWNEADPTEKDAETQADRLVTYAKAIDREPALHFLHVVTPHVPWFSTPWGTTLLQPMPHWHNDPAHPASQWSALVRYQRHSMQTGAADVALGEVLDHLHSSGVWDDTTLIVTADHGTSTIWPDVRREPTERNLEEMYRVPLFVKAPGQRVATIVDDTAMSIDLLPTLIDLLDVDVDVDWEVDGHSLLDGSARTAKPLVDTDVDGLFGVVAQHAADFPHGWSWTALAAVGEHGDLVGTELADVDVGDPSLLSWQPDHEASFASLPTARGEVPQLLTGTITTPDRERPPGLVVVVNGTIAGVTGGYEPQGHRWFFSGMVGPYYVDGPNEVAAYEVTAGPDGPVLHLLR